MTSDKVLAPKDWGKLKSNEFYAEIDDKVHPIRPNKEAVLYKGRWRAIETDGAGDTYIEMPTCGIVLYFEIKKFDQ